MLIEWVERHDIPRIALNLQIDCNFHNELTIIAVNSCAICTKVDIWYKLLTIKKDNKHSLESIADMDALKHVNYQEME